MEDNGIGIPESHVDRIFQIFKRVDPDRPGGQGVGLTIVKWLVTRHLGRIWVESVPGRGSKFFVSLPNEERTVVDT